VIIGATPEGSKELVGLIDGVRESAQSWRELLLDLKRRGLVMGFLAGSQRSVAKKATRSSSLIKPAGLHGAKHLKIPSNLSFLPLPPRSPELNSQENIWQFMRQNWLSNRIFQSFDEIVDHCCDAWNTLIHQPWKIMSIAYRDWPVIAQSM
jgi:hypothetical protein